MNPAPPEKMNSSMNSSRRWFLVLLLALAGGLAWAFFGRRESPEAKPGSASLTTPMAPGATPLPAVVEAPKMPAAKSATLAGSGAKADRAAITAAGGTIEPITVTYENNQPHMDFGEVMLTAGVPVHLTMPTGQTGTMTASVAVDGRLQVDVDVQGVAPGGQSNMVHGVAFGDAKSTGKVTFGNGEISISYTAILSVRK